MAARPSKWSPSALPSKVRIFGEAAGHRVENHGDFAASNALAHERGPGRGSWTSSDIADSAKPHGFEGLLTIEEDANVADLAVDQVVHVGARPCHAKAAGSARGATAQERDHPPAIDLLHAVKLDPKNRVRLPRRPSGNARCRPIPSYTPSNGGPLASSNLTFSVQQAR